MPLGDAEDSVDRLRPIRGNRFFSDHGAENFAERIAQVGRAGEQGLRGVWLRAGKRQQRGTAFVGNDVRSLQENDQFFPREAVSRGGWIGGNVGEIKGKASAKQR